MTTRTSRARSGLVACAVLLAASSARANDVEAARRIFAEGVKLYQKGDYEGARRLFKQADAEHHAPPIVYNLGLAEERAGHPQAAVDAYEAYVAEAGAAGDFSPAAAVAIAQIKAHSTKLRVESTPPGARVFVDGAPLPDAAPSTVLVSAGHHVVVAQGDGWRDEKDLEARGAGDALVLLLASRAPAAEPAPFGAPAPGPPAISSPPDRASDRDRDNSSSAERAHPDGFVWGVSFAIVPAYLLGVTTTGATNERPAATLVAGPTLDLGVALTERFEFVARGFVGIGPDGKPSYAYLGGPGLSYRVGAALWVGAAFVGGQLETRAHDARYGTDQVFGAMAEASFVLLEKGDGEWLATFQPAFLLTEQHTDNTTFFFPLAFGYRGY